MVRTRTQTQFTIDGRVVSLTMTMISDEEARRAYDVLCSQLLEREIVIRWNADSDIRIRTPSGNVVQVPDLKNDGGTTMARLEAESIKRGKRSKR